MPRRYTREDSQLINDTIVEFFSDGETRTSRQVTDHVRWKTGFPVKTAMISDRMRLLGGTTQGNSWTINQDNQE